MNPPDRKTTENPLKLSSHCAPFQKFGSAEGQGKHLPSHSCPGLASSNAAAEAAANQAQQPSKDSEEGANVGIAIGVGPWVMVNHSRQLALCSEYQNMTSWCEVILSQACCSFVFKLDIIAPEDLGTKSSKSRQRP